MIDPDSEEILSLRQARHAFPNRVSVPTLWRWVLNGVKGVKLESMLIGGRRYTSREACQRFMHARAGAAKNSKVPTSRHLLHSMRNASAVLDQFGV